MNALGAGKEVRIFHLWRGGSGGRVRYRPYRLHNRAGKYQPKIRLSMYLCLSKRAAVGCERAGRSWRQGVEEYLALRLIDSGWTLRYSLLFSAADVRPVR